MNPHGKVSREIREQLYLIGLDRVAKRNAFDSHMIADLSAALTEYENNPQLRCALIFAQGEHFTAGLDLIELQDKISTGVFNFNQDQIDPWGVSGRRRSKPVVVAVQGTCYTAGIELMLNADVVIASEDCRFAQLEVLRGIMPFGGATVRFVRAAGWQKAMPYLLTGQHFDAQTAQDLDLVSEVVARDTLQARGIEMATQIATAAPLGVQALLKSALTAQREGEDAAFAQLHQALQPLFNSDDAREGVMAMLQKRQPQFQGK